VKKGQHASGSSEKKDVTEIVQVSENGMDVEIFRPMSSSRSAHSPSREYEGFYSHACYTYHDLPARYWKKYQFASQFVQLVRSKTPKVTLYSDQAKCMLMENAPNPDFEACFYGGKLLSTCHIQLHQCINCLKFNWNLV